MPDQSAAISALIPTTDVYDVDVIYSLDVQSQEFKEFLVRLRQSTNNIAIAVNFRDAGYYIEEAFNCGQQFFPNKTLSSSTSEEPTYRSVIRKVIDFGDLPNNMQKSVPHNIPFINATTVFTRIYATATNPTGLEYFPIPNTFINGDITSITVDAVNVNISTNWDATAYTTCLVILEFFKG